MTAIIAALVASGCSKEDEPYRKPTFPVIGQVYVDGKPPDSPVQVMAHDVNGMDREHPTVSHTLTGEDGKFEISTYKSGDGVPEGTYKLTFIWGALNMMTMSYGGPDKLNGRYDKPETSPIEVTVKAGEPTDLGRIDLTTK